MKSPANQLRTLATAGIALIAVTAGGRAAATDFVYIGNAAQLAWQQNGDRIYFRNLHTFDPAFLGCCYNFYLGKV
jgi:hypothetical protein